METFEVIEKIGYNGKYSIYLCKCNLCGKKREVTGKDLKRLKSCGCVYEDITGNKYEKWTVLKKVKSLRSRNGESRGQTYRCKCECGTIKNTTKHMLIHGLSKSCGCTIRVGTDQRAITLVRCRYRQMAKKRGLEFKLDIKQFSEICHMPCFYCGTQPNQRANVYESITHNGKFTLYNGIDRVDNEKGYIESNCVPCCKACNSCKGEMSMKEFDEHIIKMAKHRSLTI
jgi:hypothetical protein